LTNLASDSPFRIRLLAKFVENNYEKVDRLLDIRDHTHALLKLADADIERERKNLGEINTEELGMWYLRRLDGGLFTLQTVDYILAWVAMEDDGIRGHLVQMLSRKNKSLSDIVQTLQEYHANIDEDGTDGGGHGALQRSILQNLMEFLKSC